jgi:hypothetical protein
MQRGIECALGDLEPLPGDLLDPAKDGEPVHGSPAQRFEDEQIEGTAKQVEIGVSHVGNREWGIGNRDRRLT